MSDANCLYCLETDRKACGQSNQETRIVGGKPTGVNVRINLFSQSSLRQSKAIVLIDFIDFTYDI